MQAIGECELQPDCGRRGYIKVWLTVEAPSREALTVEGMGLAPFLVALTNLLGDGRLCILTNDWWMNQSMGLEPEAAAVWTAFFRVPRSLAAGAFSFWCAL